MPRRINKAHQDWMREEYGTTDRRKIRRMEREAYIDNQDYVEDAYHEALGDERARNHYPPGKRHDAFNLGRAHQADAEARTDHMGNYHGRNM